MNDELHAWLAKLGCQEYLELFKQNGVTMDLLPELDSGALAELGVTRLGDRLRLQLAIADLQAKALQRKMSVEEARRTFRAERAPARAASRNPPPDLPDEEPARVVTFILPDGLLKKVNVDGCFNAQLVKRKVLKTLGVRGRDNEYDTHMHTVAPGGGVTVRRLNDVEFVTICFAPKRQEKHRLMLTAKDEAVSAAAAEALLRILQRMAGRKPASAAMRLFFGLRPPSELISLNLGQYFPSAGTADLESTIRNLVRHSMRLLRRMMLLALLLGEGARRTVGDFLVHNVSLVDEATHVGDAVLVVLLALRHRVVTLFALPALNRYLRIELMSTLDDDDDFGANLETAATDGESAGEAAGDADAGAGAPGPDVAFSAAASLGAPDFGAGRKWVQGARIGAGLFGVVYLGMDPSTGELMAVKQVPLPAGGRNSDQHRGMVDALHREMLLLKGLSHENIVRYYGLSSEGDFLNIFLEYIPGGSVQLMLKLYGPFEEPLIRSFVRQVLVGLSYLHGMDIIHRDIKGANILIDIKGAAKISDFGISKKIDAREELELDDVAKTARRASLQGLVYWMAPEVVKQTAYTKKADIWSVGCLVVEMFTGNHPFPKFSQMQAIFKIGTHTCPEIPEWSTVEGKDFLAQTFEADYERRPSAVDLLAEPFVTPLVVTSDEFM